MDTKITSAGKKIRAIRESKSIDIETLAERSMLTPEQISAIEDKETLPSLSPLIKIARALGVRLGTFLDDADMSNIGAVVCRAGERKVGINFSNDASWEGETMQYFPLSDAKENRHIEPFIIDILPTEKTAYTMESHEGEEFIYILDGTVEISYGKHTYTLNAGDSIHYDCIVRHHVHTASGCSSARILAVVYVPF